MHRHPSLTRLRLARFTEELLTPALYPLSAPLAIEAWEVPDEPVPFDTARAASYTPFEIGQPWGRAWSTVWFHLTGRAPAEWPADGHAPEVLIDLGFDSAVGPGFQAEALVYRSDGAIVKGVEPRNRHVPIRPCEEIDLWVEAAANPPVASSSWIHPTPLGAKETAPAAPLYRLRQAELALRSHEAHALAADLRIAVGLADELPEDSPRRAELECAIEDALDAVDPDDVAGTLAAGRAALARVLGEPAAASAHVVHAVGHAHIDSAWLWPIRETRRKCARTFSNVLALMDEYPELVFACSSAQQHQWVKEDHPELFERIKAQVAAGRFVPVGGMWVEPDLNLTGGESVVRHFLQGKSFFASEYGIEPLDVWVPDTFGYSAALPQIIRLAGSKWFLTQKISWNDTNTMPHHTFWWEGIDGTRVFTHFPPVDTYNAELTPAELARAQRSFRDKGRANTSLAPFGFGDGGGGPTREMMEAGRRQADLDGSPKVEFSSVERFFEAAAEEFESPAVWRGELYLEYHRGTYTTQAETKAGNRRNETLLREAEWWATSAAVRTGAPYPAAELEALWREVLLLQFHDILPGSSIAWVHRESEAAHQRITRELEALIERSLAALVGEGDAPLVASACPFPLASDAATCVPGAVVAPSMVVGEAVATDAPGGVASRAGEGYRLASERLDVRVDAFGLVTSIRDLAADRELVPAGERGALLQLLHDRPNQWDAWDVDRQASRMSRDLDAADSVDVVAGPGGEIVVRRSFGASTAIQRLRLSPAGDALDVVTEVDWHERRKMLKLAFPLDVHADRAAAEIQFGHVMRPLNDNTTWDEARFETSCHRWFHIGEPDYGVAIANATAHGHDVAHCSDGAGRTWARARVSLLRSPVFPDAEADQGRHRIVCRVAPGVGIDGAVAAGYQLNATIRALTGTGPVAPLVTSSAPGVVVEALKLAEDGSGDVIVRLYEALGQRASATIAVDCALASAQVADLMERAGRDVCDDAALTARLADTAELDVRLRPFQILTLRLARR